MSELREIVKRAQGLQAAIANDVFKTGARLWCTECGREQRANRQELGYYLGHGWPTCCGYTMRLEMDKEAE